MNRIQKENLKHRQMIWVSKRYVVKMVDTPSGPVKIKTVEGLGTLDKKRLIQQNLLPLQSQPKPVDVNSKTW